MEPKYSIKRAAVVVGILAFVSITAVAQENRSEISIQGTGFFTKDTAGKGVFQHADDTGGFLLGYRYNFNRWLAAEANYGYDRNTQFCLGGTPARVQADIHQITGAAVVKLPTFLRLQPYALAGAGGLVFAPTGNSGGSFAGATTETKAAFVYGVGAQYAFTRHLSFRAEYRGLVVQGAELQPGWPQYGQLDADCPTVSRHCLSLLMSRDRRRGRGVQPNTRAAPFVLMMSAHCL
jgi:opacity protein-like surface antigen